MTRPRTRGAWPASRRIATTSRTRPTWSPFGSNTTSPARRAQNTRVVAVVMLARLPPWASRLADVRELAYHVVDVFTDRPFACNAPAVVLDADDDPTAAMQAIAKEFNLSETAFPVAVSPTEYTLRIFTPQTELPFAGHPSVGSAWLLYSIGLLDA